MRNVDVVDAESVTLYLFNLFFRNSVMLSELPDSISLSDGLAGSRNNSLPGYGSRVSVVSEPTTTNHSTSSSTSKDTGILAMIAGQSPGSKSSLYLCHIIMYYIIMYASTFRRIVCRSQSILSL